jgi:maltooligosyltrehalose trehalohydrolase
LHDFNFLFNITDKSSVQEIKMIEYTKIPYVKNIGADLHSDKSCQFRVWASDARSVELINVSEGTYLPMNPEGDGYWNIEMKGISHGFLYKYRLNGNVERSDPASQWQPQGVHGPSAVVDHSTFQWSDDAWTGLPVEQFIQYEIHTGTFSGKGTFEGIIEKLPYLRDLGITAVEIMPVAQFPGNHNWGYDGVYPFAVQTTYGGVNEFKKLVNSCHAHNLAVILDVVYNHLGPEGNYIWEYGPYFTTNKYSTPWGWAVNFDDTGSDNVRSYFITNAIYWMEYFHIDALRLDAVHAIYDMCAVTFLEDLVYAVDEYGKSKGRKRFLIAECDRNDPRIVTSRDCGGYGLDAQWCDELHHALHAAITSEKLTYYEDFGSCADVAKALHQGFVHDGTYSKFRKRRHGASAERLKSIKCVVCSQNHDQVGNRALGERLISLSSPQSARLAAAAVLFSPMIPLLFMGEEWGETHPFLYFVDHGDPQLCDAVREGRRKEFAEFHLGKPVPDPVSASTFEMSKLDWSKEESISGQQFIHYYRQLILLRRNHPVLSNLSFETTKEVAVHEEGKLISIQREFDGWTLFQILYFGTVTKKVSLPFNGRWTVLFDSNNEQWGGDTVALTEHIDGSESVITAMSVKLYEHRGI